jgi:hypothetical protein
VRDTACLTPFILRIIYIERNYIYLFVIYFLKRFYQGVFTFTNIRTLYLPIYQHKFISVFTFTYMWTLHLPIYQRFYLHVSLDGCPSCLVCHFGVIILFLFLLCTYCSIYGLGNQSVCCLRGGGVKYWYHG